MANEPKPQSGGAWPHCEWCGKPVVSDGLGTALKPATEIICVGRKALSERTIAANILRWGTGAVNVDACRIEAADKTPAPVGQYGGSSIGPAGHKGLRDGSTDGLGRWPANVITDGSDEVIAAFPNTAPSSGRPRNNGAHVTHGHDDAGGSTARFFYAAKADADDRLGSKHPTVKPLDLMQWLVRLVTPPAGLVLDCFAGTGTTGHAALLEGRRAILIDRDSEYQADIERRMSLVFAGQDERRGKLTKQDASHGPLFGDAP